MIVETSCGRIEGSKENGLRVFKGIPYGEAPIGDLRFKAPMAKKQWQGILKCQSYGRKSMQYYGDDESILNMQSEDCLYLNIWTKDNQIINKAVIVYIHGGGFTGGCGNDDILIGDTFGTDENIIYVSINYRLGALGFLNLKETLGEEYTTSGSNGILDIILSLQWIKDNIKYFGGDKGNITVMGESAGAKCIGGLLVSPMAKGLFNKAILQSGAIQALRSEETSSKITKRFLKEINISKDESKKLLEISAEDIVRAQSNIYECSSIHIFGPIVDGQVIPYDYKVLGKDDGLESVLMGFNKEEILIFLNGNKNPLRERNTKALKEIFGKNVSRMWQVYEGYLKNREPQKAYEEALTHCYYKIHSLKLADILSDNGVDVWFYRFNWAGKFGPCHAQDLAFVFNKSIPKDDLHTIPKKGKVVANTMHNTWKCFIKSNNPNNEMLPKWEIYSKENRNFMNLDYEFYMDNKWNEEELQSFPQEVLML